MAAARKPVQGAKGGTTTAKTAVGRLNPTTSARQKKLISARMRGRRS